MSSATHDDILAAVADLRRRIDVHSAREVPVLKRLEKSVYGENGLQDEMIKTRTVLRLLLWIVGVLGTATVGLLFALVQQAIIR